MIFVPTNTTNIDITLNERVARCGIGDLVGGLFLYSLSDIYLNFLFLDPIIKFLPSSQSRTFLL